MTLWGSQLGGALGGFIEGDVALGGGNAVPGMNVRRLASNPLIDVQGNASAPPIGGGQRHLDVPIGPYLVTQTQVILPNGAPLYTSNAAALSDWGQLAARVVFGRAGTKQEAWVDWPRQGGKFVVACDTLSVNVLALNQQSGAIGVPYDVRCGAWATPIRDSLGDIALPRYTMFLNDLAAGGGSTGDIMIPPFARRWRMQMNLAANTAALSMEALYRVRAITQGRDTFITTPVGQQGGWFDWSPWFEVPTWAWTIVINSLGGGAPAVPRPNIVFELDLG